MKLSAKDWRDYVERLRKVNETAAQKMQAYIDTYGIDDMERLVDYAFALATTYGEANGALACEMYDAVAEASNVNVPPAEMAPTATYEETAQAMYGTLMNKYNTLAATVGRLTKQVSADTMLQNGLRDGAKFAWIPHGGETCAFCITLASNGWQNVSKRALKNGHAEHIHANCHCEYAISFDADPKVEGYDPDKYLRMYYGAPLDGQPPTPRNRINALSRMLKKEQVNNEGASADRDIYRTFKDGDEANAYFGKRPPRQLRRTDRAEYDRQREAYAKSMFGSWYESLTGEQTTAIGEYSGDSYSAINGLLRHQMTEKMVDKWNAISPMSISSMIDEIEKAIDTFELTEPIKVYRTCEKDILENLRLQVGGVFHDDGFGSTSILSKKVASGNIVLEINVPKGHGHGAWINPLSGAEDEEYEFLLQRGSDYKILNIKNVGDDTVVELDLVGNTKTKWSYASRDEVINLWKQRGTYDETSASQI